MPVNQPVSNATTRHGIVLLLAAVMPAMAIIALVPVLPLLQAEFADVPGQAVLVPMALTIPALCVALFSPPAGWLSDRVGRKPLLLAALLAYAGFGLLPLLLGNLFQIIAARFALGLAEAAIMTVATTMIGDYFIGPARDRWIAAQLAVVSISAIVLIAVGGALGELLGTRGPFWLYLLALPVALAAALILFEPARAANDDQAGTGLAVFRPILGLAAITLGVGLLFYTILVQLGPLVAEATGITSPATIGIIGAAANIGVATGAFLFARRKLAAGPGLLSIGLGLSGLGYLGAGLAGDPWLIGVAAVAACLGNGLMLPNMLAWTLARLPAPARGGGTGIWTGAFFLGQFAAPIIAGALGGMLGGLGNLLMVYGALALVLAIFTRIAAGRSRSKPATP
jgi:MFS family permease